jgi:hypothetical protein
MIMSLFSMLLLLEPDLGSCVVLATLTLGMMFVGLMPLRYVAFLILIGICVFFILVYSAPYRLERLLSFQNPWQYAMHQGYQLTHSLMAIGSGGFFGVGIGQSLQRLSYLPEAHTDFIFSVICEELGWVGALIMLGVFFWLVIRMWLIAKSCMLQNKPFRSYLVWGVILWICSQVGNPVRQSIRNCQTHDSAKNLLIVGGSLGAGFLSQTLLPVILASFPGISVTCITGRGAQPKDHQSLISTYPHLKLIEYMDNIEQLYAHSSLVITRAGAMAVSEITLLGLRALFVPLPKSADNHQWHNAKSVQCEGIVVENESVDHIIVHMKLLKACLWPKPQPKDNHALQAITACLID